MVKVLVCLGLLMSLVGSAAYAGDDAAAKLFDAKCAKCHGKDGKGTDKMAKVLKVDKAKLDLTGAETAKVTDADLLKVSNEGRKKMPKFKGKLEASQLEALVQYIRSLAPAKK